MSKHSLFIQHYLTTFPPVSAAFSVLNWRQMTNQRLSTEAELFFSTGPLTAARCQGAVKPPHHFTSCTKPRRATCRSSCFSFRKKLLSTCSSPSSHVSCCLAVLSRAATKKLLASNTASAFGVTAPSALRRWAAQELAPASVKHPSTTRGSAPQPSPAADRHAKPSHAAVRSLLTILSDYLRFFFC